ncbi:MAG TPA: 3-hydroxyacyl-CoA dehydrogenase/enoyl-CoA hydratase family protein [Polyangiaceae bacterium LLY-WYZ-15_(1-7)]|nr:3-hydroxyacyl-CoA dehydrogenase [Myxococcales bacterium]MAT26559.1 3-hydroxyacyl-CoA dehydrogenase [Sandaracinus sp.]HJK94989.1 3-hydroxyacyl-CoA dehydrogenase/enoyl-CoA hydratase family protein [Polyangiaceae bacterium LLY-WYZ-15_(1-7)]MBJ74523.1 3-hydroxyacyl-CoA dehydrogenase [Sandaracinus sp.]HJL02457.1 3-hydroxyacyl-CoA dehydrogenase/enoyl-CoA hydratase family protein [Polyangiaceae bacterium LLY-WYZ-15_(1-7)]
MTEPIRRVGVIGAGVMGSGIAAHFANAGVEVVLLDIVPPNLSDEEKKDPKKRSAFAEGALAKTKKAKPALFFHKQNASLVSTGNLEDHLDLLKDVDLVIEAIIENLDIKRSLFEKLEKTVRADTIIASNTSGLKIEDMVEGRGEGFAKNFLVMHFFNPVRYMKLLELVVGPKTDPAVLERVVRCAGEQLGKGVVMGKDTPNFVGNRIGCHSMMLTMHTMEAMRLEPEDVDAITGKPMAHPKSASFRTADMVGLDTFLHVTDNCYAALTDDEERDVFQAPGFLRKMVEEKKLLGNKTKGGFYKKTKEGIFTLDLKTLEYRPKGGDADIKKAMKGIKGSPAERVRKLVATEGKAGEFAWKVLSGSLAYAARRIPEIADDVESVDNAMKWGYNWELGPFEVWDALGFAETTKRMKDEGIALPAGIDTMLEKGAEGFYQGTKMWDLVKGEYVERDLDPREAPLANVRTGESAVLANGSAEAWDLGDGVLGLTFKSKSNSIDDGVIEMLGQAVAKAETDFRGLLLFNEGQNFCVGANLFAVVMAAQQKQWDALRTMVKALHAATQQMKYSKVPVVAAPYGMTLGGGLEICLASDAVQAAAETYAGLVEPGVGLVPGGAGHVNMLWRALEGIPDGTMIDVQPFVARVFQNIALARVATSGVEAQYFGYFRRTDGISFDRARHLYEAKQKVIGMAETGYKPKAPRAWKLPGASGIATLTSMVDDMVLNGHASEHDGLIAKKVAEILCGGPGGHTHPVTEEEMLELECEAFLSLCGEEKSQARMQYMLMNNKPLRN